MKQYLLSCIIGLSFIASTIGNEYNFHGLPTEQEISACIEEGIELYGALPEEGKEIVHKLCELDIQMFEKTGEIFQALFKNARVADNAQQIMNVYHAQVEEMNAFFLNRVSALRDQYTESYAHAELCVTLFRLAIMPNIEKMALGLAEACKVLDNGYVDFPVSVITQDMVDHINTMKPAGFQAVSDVITQYQDILAQL